MSHLTQPPLRQSATVAVIAGLALILAAILAVGQAPAAQAAPLATFYVNGATGSDSNNCLAPGTACATIGAAVSKASANDTIEIASGTYFENAINVDKRLTINGAGAESTIVDGGQNGRIFNLYVDGSLSNLTVQNGKTADAPNIYDSGGGAILVGTSANVLLQNVTMRDNMAAGSGGAIFNSGNLTIDQSILRGNQAEGIGGAIYHYGIIASSGVTITQSLVESNVALGIYGGGISVNRNIFIQDSTFRDNESTSFGGGVHLSAWGTEPTRATLERSTLQGNRSSDGAGLFIEYTSLVTMTNVTVSGNIASGNYAGIYAAGPGTLLTLRNSTVAGNSRTNAAGVGRNGLLVTSDAAATLYNTIIADNQGDECLAAGSVTITSLGHNLSSDNSCFLTEGTDLPNTDPLLMPLGDYGGTTLTHALRPGSPAIDGGNNTNCPATDQRGVVRPYDGDNTGSATCDMGAVEAQHQLTIEGVTVAEGTGGSNSAVFTVTLSPANNQAVTVDYTTQNDSATAPADFTATSGSLTFSPGQTVRTISVPIVTDGSTEPDETFLVQLSNPANAALLIGTATGTILNDDGLPTLNIGNVSVAEGNGGAVNAVFNVALSLASAQTVTVNYATQDDSATAPADYTATSGSLTFTPGQTAKQITVQVKGDNIDEGTSEQFRVVLSSPTNGVLGTATGTGAITDDDTARLNLLSSPDVMEGDSGTTPAVLTVTLSTPTAFVVTVDYEVVSGFGETGATAGVDFTGQFSATLTFQPGEMAKNFGVDVVGDTQHEPDEQFRANIKNASAPIVGSAAFVTILNDDVSQEMYEILLPLIDR
jgi:hypothetical protein